MHSCWNWKGSSFVLIFLKPIGLWIYGLFCCCLFVEVAAVSAGMAVGASLVGLLSGIGESCALLDRFLASSIVSQRAADRDPILKPGYLRGLKKIK
jgi:hypothetical protein